MAPYSFKPIIESSGKGWQLTAPHELRDRVWDHLNLFHSYQVIRKEGGTPTQITVTANPGYLPREAVAMLAVATYFETSGLDLESFWDMSVRDHLDNLGEQVDIKFAGEGLTQEAIQPALQLLILELARRDLRTLMNKLKGGYNDDYLQGLIDQSEEALRRLIYYPAPVTDMVLVRRGDPLQPCQRSIEYMQMCLEGVVNINRRIDGIRQYHSDQVVSIGKITDLSVLTHTNWKLIRRELIEAGVAIERVRSEFDLNEFMKAYKVVRSLTPPARVESKK